MEKLDWVANGVEDLVLYIAADVNASDEGGTREAGDK